MKRKAVVVEVPGTVAIHIDPEIAEELKRRGLYLGFNPGALHEREYPWVFALAPYNVPLEPLHLFVWKFFNGANRPLREGEVIHHRNRNKLDARIANLGVGSRAAHAKAHADDQQRFRIRKKDRLDGFYRPHAPAEVRTIDGGEKAAIEKDLLARRRQEDEAREAGRASLARYQGPSTPPMSDDEVERALEDAYRRLKPIIEAEDSGLPIPPPASRPRQRDRMLRLPRIRRGCTVAEVGLVFSLIDQGFDVEAVAHDLRIPRTAIEKLMREPAVDLALANWHSFRRLPEPNAPEKLRPWRGGPKEVGMTN